MIIKVTKDNFESVKNGDKPLLLDFYADWCGPCRALSPIIDQIAAERTDITVGKVNVDEQGELAAAFGIVSIPALIVMKDGEIANRATGARPKAQVLALIDG